MFDSILISDSSESDVNGAIDLGVLLESMFFYKSTHVIVRGPKLGRLIRAIGFDQLVALVEEQHLKITFSESLTSIATTTSKTGTQVHTPVIVVPQRKFDEEVRRLTEELNQPQRDIQRIAKWLESNISVTRHDLVVCEGAKKSLLDQNYLKNTIPAIVENSVPNCKDIEGIEFHPEALPNGGFLVHTNLDFKAIAAAQQEVPQSVRGKQISPASILTKLFRVESDLYFSSTYLCELAADPFHSQLMTARLDYLVQTRSQSESNISRFQELVFDDARAVREAINGQKVDIADVVSVIRKSTKFKEWVANKDRTQDLVKEYYKDVTRDTFVDKLPGKSARWAIFTGLGIVADVIGTGGFGLGAGIGLGALDTFMFDKLIKGWKPNQFIETDVKMLLK